jgi:hypothetical protein
VIIIAICLICCAVSGIASFIIQQRMVDKINAALPSEQRIDPIGWWWFKQQRLLQEYRRLDPQCTLMRRQAIWISLGIVAIAIASTVMFRSIFSGLWLGLGGAIILWFSLRMSRPKS